MRAATAGVERSREGRERITLPVLLGGRSHGRIVPSNLARYQPLIVPMPLRPPAIMDPLSMPLPSDLGPGTTMYTTHMVVGPGDSTVEARCATSDSQCASRLIWDEIRRILRGTAWEQPPEDDC